MPPKCSAAAREHRLHRGFVRDVDLDAEPTDLAGDLLRRRSVDVGGDDLRALFREPHRGVGAHPAAGAGDHADLVLKSPAHSVE